MIGAVFTVLDRSSSKYLRCKAFDIYSAINLFPQIDSRNCGEPRDRESIDAKLEESKDAERIKGLSLAYIPQQSSLTP
jgi:hypothetical protein